MKNFKIVALVVAITLSTVSVIYPATCTDPFTCVPSVNIPIKAQVPDGTPELSIVIKSLNQANQDPWTGTTVTQMDYGLLTHALSGGGDAGVWYSQTYFCVFIFTTSFGHAYEIRSTCSGLTSGANSLPSGSFGLTPSYIAQDEWSAGNPQGAIATGATVGDPGSAIVTNKVIYRSEPAASNRIIRAFYSLPCYLTGGAVPFTGYTPIALSQAAGTYTGTVTISIVAI